MDAGSAPAKHPRTLSQVFQNLDPKSSKDPRAYQVGPGESPILLIAKTDIELKRKPLEAPAIVKKLADTMKL